MKNKRKRKRFKSNESIGEERAQNKKNSKTNDEKRRQILKGEQREKKLMKGDDEQ